VRLLFDSGSVPFAETTITKGVSNQTGIDTAPKNTEYTINTTGTELTGQYLWATIQA